MSVQSNLPRNPYVFLVPEEKDGNQLRNFLTRYCGLSRRRVREAALRGDILVNDQPRYLNQPVWAGERVTLYYQCTETSNVAPQEMPLRIIYEDSDILLVEKPPNLVVHPTLGYTCGTLANSISFYWQQKGCFEPIRIVTRLDQNTSGLVLIATNEIAHHLLVQQFQQGRGIKKYLALVEGKLGASGTINQPIDYSPDSIIKRRVSAEGKPAITHYRTIKTLPQCSLVEIRLETGRTHQIRVHFATIGHPVIGDTLYGASSTVIPRQALHAYFLRFPHPRTGRIMEFDCPLPHDIQQAIKTLGAQN